MAETKTQSYRWKNRLILVDQAVAQSTVHFQKIKSENLEAWNERKLRLVSIPRSELSLRGSEDAQTLLVGLDGTVKKSYLSLPTFQDVTSTIDAMPMRQREVQGQKAR